MAGVFEGNYMPFFLTLGGVRLLQTFLFAWMLYKNPSIRPVTYNILQGFTVASVLWIVSAFVPSPVHFIVMLAALLIDILTPQTRGKGNTKRYLNVHHLQERLGLFLMLVIGESMIVVALSNSASLFSVTQLATVFSGLGLMIALWWLYFEHNDDHVGVRPKNLFAFLHAHGFLYGSIIATSVAYKLLLEGKGGLDAITFLLLGAFGISVSLIIIRSTLHEICNRSILLTSGLLLVGALIAFRGWEVDRVHETVITITLVFILTAILDYFSFFKETKEG
jgi:low temperature requirement protein LtrA